MTHTHYFSAAIILFVLLVLLAWAINDFRIARAKDRERRRLREWRKHQSSGRKPE